MTGCSHQANIHVATTASWDVLRTLLCVEFGASIAPLSLSKRGVLSVDGVRRWVALERGILTVHANEAGEAIVLQADMTFVEVVWSNATPSTMHLPPVASTELRVTIEPEALNRQVETGRASVITPIGSFANPVPTTTELRGEQQRRTMTLFADTAAEKHAWAQALQSVASGRRGWAHARHEASVTMNAVRRMGQPRS